MNTTNLTTYFITFINLDGEESTLPVISTSATQAVTDLTTLGYKLRKITYCFPTV